MVLSNEGKNKVDNLVSAINNKVKTSSDLEINILLDILENEIKKE